MRGGRTCGGRQHVVLRLKAGLPSMRTPRTYRVIEGAFRKGKERFGCGVLQYSVMGNHLHMIVEAWDRRALSRFMQGLGIRLARALNRKWGRKGKVFADRFFARALEDLRQIKRAIKYVLSNARKHGIPIPIDEVDRYSSARWYRKWNGPVRRPLRAAPVASPRLFCAFRLTPYLRKDEVPGFVPTSGSLHELGLPGS